MAKKYSGKQLAKARDKWFESDDGKNCCEGTATGQYLKNRLEKAFIAGFDAFFNMGKANTEVGIAQGKRMDFDNNMRGKPFEETGRQIKPSEIRKLTGGFSERTVPADCEVLVAGADYHKSRARGIVRIDYEIRGFAAGMKNYVIDTDSVPSFDKLDEMVLASSFAWADGAKKPELAVVCMFVDSGYEPDDVYEYCRQRPWLTIPTKGEKGPRLKPLQPSDLETATERRLSRRSRVRYKGMQLIIIDTCYFKNQVTTWALPRINDEGKIIAEPLTAFYDQTPAHYFREFTNEQKVRTRDTRGNTKWVWKPITTGAPTHSLDTAVLCAAAGYYKGVQNLRSPDQKTIRPAAAARKKIRLSDIQKKKRGIY